MRPEHPLDPPRQKVELRAGPVSYTSTGGGRPLVAVHGMPASGRDYRWLDALVAWAGELQRTGKAPAAPTEQPVSA